VGGRDTKDHGADLRRSADRSSQGG